ncbi:MAG TPA: hypothetical protein VN289_19450 [Paraburkholderia sp.]|nr:hypothetical protein [Paraburkholderia sp.]
MLLGTACTLRRLGSELAAEYLRRVPMTRLTNGRAGAQRAIVTNLTAVFGIRLTGKRINLQ